MQFGLHEQQQANEYFILCCAIAVKRFKKAKIKQRNTLPLI